MDTQPSYKGLKTFKFGDSPAMADRLAALVVAGVKTGTCYAAVHGPEAEIGERQICLSSEDIPLCEIETVSLQILRFDDVTPEMAALEGEGDLSYRYWRDVHQAYYQREKTWALDMNVIFETFKVTRILDEDFTAMAQEALKAERAEAFANGYTALGVSHG